MSELDSIVYWISTVRRIHAINLVLSPVLLLIFGAFLFMLGAGDINDAGKKFAMRWLWLVVVLQMLNISAHVFIPSQKDLAMMAKQRIHELNATVSPKVEEYIDSCIETKCE